VGVALDFVPDDLSLVTRAKRRASRSPPEILRRLVVSAGNRDGYHAQGTAPW
jgi:hypothetical protein